MRCSNRAGSFASRSLSQDCILDSNELERERGITILAKNISLNYKGVKINIIDTPGHADFGGEVERVLRMADGAIILVDAFEGPRPQTRFVLTKALEVGLKPLIVVNKIDRPDSRPEDVYLETVELINELGAADALDIPTVYGSGRDGFMNLDPEARGGDMTPLLDLVLEHIPGPLVDVNQAFQMMVTSMQWSEFVGRVAIGRISAGGVQAGDNVVIVTADGVRNASVDSVELFDKLGRVKTDIATAGDICALVGLPEIEIGDTIASPQRPVALPRITVDEPTLSMVFTINSSPLSGKSGKFLTSRHLRERLKRELESNVALRVEETSAEGAVQSLGSRAAAPVDSHRARCGGKVTNCRSASRRSSASRSTANGTSRSNCWRSTAPTEDVGSVMELVSARRGQLIEMNAGAGGHTHLEFSIPARGLIGLRTRMLNATRGRAVMHHRFDEYRPFHGEMPGRKNGVIISQRLGQVDRLRPVEAAGADGTVRQAGRRRLRRDDRRRELPRQRPGGQPGPREEADQRPLFGGRRRHPAATAPRDVARSGIGVHRVGRIRRSDAGDDPPPQRST